MSFFSLEGDGMGSRLRADGVIFNVGCVQVASDGWAVRVSGAYFVVFGPSRLIQWVTVCTTPISRADTLLGRRRFTSFHHIGQLRE